jgi:dephospho-CoA kinase
LKKVGLTGGIGSGKSYVAQIFAHLGVPIFYADADAKEVLNQPDILAQLSTLFKADIIDPNTKLANRKKIAEIVFSDANKLNQLNQLIHPITKQNFELWAAQNKSHGYVIKEAAVMFESGANKLLDKIITVSSPLNLRIKRVMQRDHVAKEEVTKRINNQISEEERIKLSQFVIYNNEIDLLLPQVLKIHEQLKK